ncbi:penicillin acylase family protein [Methylobacter sp. YRD-M1]|uniref:penicillin acylase family protein n=1 Tax=Methylobacter sp. YRD-M1 TaxID=2911520 RepID=UPI00227D62AB|nr:penicillin acylase family protein [Methylobacter sp. YRD-M1]WAK02528.1 penicillin acylase family protein [Methylobacter sp. YRD-M1]
MLGLGAGFLFLERSLPPQDGEFRVQGLFAPVTVTSDSHGIPVIKAGGRADALRALGYVTARDRLFQMELMRRKNAGRLAELFGQIAVNNDIRARTYGFSRVAKAVVAKLPQAHRRYLEAYADGVNSYIDNARALPFEFTVLDYRPERWRPEDSLLVVLGMFDNLTAWSEKEERMLTVMEKSLPADVVSFLTPDTDRFTDSLYGDAEPYRPVRPIPVASLETALARHAPAALKLTEAVQLQDQVAGSNAWAVGGARTHDGRAILANDMHLGISVPNIWYRTEMDYGTGRAAGVTLPGMPVFIAGSNERLAWGGTNLTGDFLDLVSLEINPQNPDKYRVGDKWQPFEQVSEIIRVKDAEPLQVTVRRSIWGPVAQEPLLGQPVAVHWSALDDTIVNLGLLDLDQAETLEQAMAVVNHTGGPQLNFLVADNHGRIGWTVMGQIPKRVGFDGSVSRSWADGSIGWDGYVDERQLPREIDPAAGILVSANDRRLGKAYPHVIGRQFASGYRAYRITQRLKEMPVVNEWTMFGLQLDTEIEFYGFYQQLALDVLSPKAIERQPELQELRDTLLAWNGRADRDSLGFALLERFRRQLAISVFSPFLEASRSMDKNFNYAWSYIDTPLQAMLTEKVPQLLPDPVNYHDWDDFILGQLKRSAQQLKTDYPDTALSELAWGQVNKAQIGHPFSKSLPLLGVLLDMPADALAGCANCVRAVGPTFGASERMVVSPAHLDDGIMHMPGGQSGHPLSSYYRDQHRHWVKGLPLALLADKPEHRLTLQPDVD